MKYVVILGDGMADYRQEILDGKTQLSVLKVNELLRREKKEREGDDQ